MSRLTCGSLCAPAGRLYSCRYIFIRMNMIKAVDLLSGPSGLASFLRRRQLGARLGGPSLPLDVGYSETIPASIRNAVTLRDKHCQWAGQCNQPASACEVHHVKHKSKGRQDQPEGLHTTLLVPPSNCDPSLGMDPGSEPRRDHHGVEPGQNQGPQKPQPAGPPWVRRPAMSDDDRQARRFPAPQQSPGTRYTAPDDTRLRPEASVSSGAVSRAGTGP